MHSFLNLPKKERSEIFNAIAQKTGRSALILEKDMWLCWSLALLFEIPNKPSIAFKGGTSLSKVFGVIQRFSEDIDISIDCHAFDLSCDPIDPNTSKSKLKLITKEIRTSVTNYLKNKVIPYYENIIAQEFKTDAPQLTLDNDGETLYINYPSVIEQNNIGYIQDSVRLEFGGRNLTIPNNLHIISPYLAEHVADLTFPHAKVTVLSPQKTFWEKITLIHYECNRGSIKNDAARISRHWYDVAMLSKHEIGKNALNNLALLREVIKIKSIFYNASYAKYDDCLNGKLRLLPNEESLKNLKHDFNNMLLEKMFYGDQPNFNSMVEEIIFLEHHINKLFQ